MRFWDTSAIVPLCSDEVTTDAVNALFSEDPLMIISFITPVEVTSAIARRAERNELLRARAKQRLDPIQERWTVVSDFSQVLNTAMDIVRKYELRGADAIQLASAIHARESAQTLEFVTNDVELAIAARAEGFRVLPQA